MLSLVTLYVNRGIAQGREVSDTTLAASTFKKNSSRMQRATVTNATTEFSSLGDLTASSDTETATKNNPEVSSPIR